MISLYKSSLIVHLFFFTTLFAIVPFFKSLTFFNLLYFSLNCGCSFLLLGLHWRMKQSLSLVWIVAHIGFCYLVFFSLLTRNYALIGRFAEYLILANSLQLLLYCKRNILLDQLIKPVHIISVAVVISCISTLFAYSYDPGASRDVSDNPSLFARNIGGYGYIYCLLFFVIGSQLKIQFSDKKNAIVWWSIVFTLCVMTLFGSRFLIASTFLFVLLFIFYLLRQPPFHYGGPVIRSIIGFFVLLLLILIGNWMYQNESYLITKAFNIVLALTGGLDSSYLGERISQYLMSVRGLFEFPFFGVLAGGGDVFGWRLYGRHSFILDNYALFGLLGGTVYLYILLAPWLEYRSRLGLSYQTVYLCGGTVLLLALTNILSPEILVTAYLIVPAIAILENDEIRQVSKTVGV